MIISVKEAFIGRSYKGVPVIAFDTQDKMNEWIKQRPYHHLNFFKQIITEEHVEIEQI